MQQDENTAHELSLLEQNCYVQNKKTLVTYQHIPPDNHVRVYMCVSAPRFTFSSLWEDRENNKQVPGFIMRQTVKKLKYYNKQHMMGTKKLWVHTIGAMHYYIDHLSLKNAF